jgi:uridine kinase
VTDFGALVEATPSSGVPALVAVDGVDASGKTTFAAGLAGAFAERQRAVEIVHLDDFLNPRSTRYQLGRTSPEGYFLHTYDLAAFKAKVLTPLRPGGDGSIVRRVFDHREDRPVEDEPVVVPPNGVVIVEGMFLHRDELHERWDLSVFLDVPFPVSVARMAQRDGSQPDPEDPSVRRYVQGQRVYLTTCRPWERATYVLGNT